MVLIHVPNHYNRFNNLLTKYKDKSIIFIFGIGLLLFSFLQKDPTLIENTNVISIGEYIIIGHIIYEELYTKEKFNHFQI
jgi:amino acid transporter